MAKSANLLVDGLGAPEQIGLLLPLHWQSVALVLGGVTSGATVVVARSAGELRDCAAAFVLARDAEAALDAGVDDVLVVSEHPMGLSTATPPGLAVDFAREVPGYGDVWTGPFATTHRVLLDGAVLAAEPLAGVGDVDRVLVAGALPDVLPLLLSSLAASAALVLVPDPAGVDLPALVRTEHITATAGLPVAGLRRLNA